MIPQYKFINSEQEFKSVLEQNFNDKVDMISLTEFGPSQIELLIKCYEQQKQNTKIIHGFLVGVDKFLPQINDKVQENVIIANAKGSFSASLGEYVVFSCLYHAKRVPFFLDMQKQKKWIREPISMIKNKNIAIFGFGDIGLTIGKQCKLMGMNVHAVKRDPDQNSQEQLQTATKIYGMEQADEVLKNADYVCNIMPLTPKTDKYFNLEKFKIMQNHSVFINVGRGQSVVEPDLIQALKDKEISGASLDVFDVEPLDKNSELWNFDNVFISQHCGDVTDDYLELTYDTFQDNLQLHLQGKQMKNIVDRQKGY